MKSRHAGYTHVPSLAMLVAIVRGREAKTQRDAWAVVEALGASNVVVVVQ